ncbi:nuclear transport factor 2 family protein [Pedomonas sp. V897]|uniref:nuclear transport factor 2 family protein n=1 Tax=Pedomonas sp. V897 TaxID=3446482 RepID=UPI003EE1DBDA
MATDLVQLVKDAYASMLERGDIEGFLDFFAEDGALLEADTLPYGGRHVGRDAIRSALHKMAGSFSNFSFQPEVFTTADEWVVVYGTFTATARNSGKTASFKLAEAVHIVDGKIKLINPVYGDTAAILEILR